MRTGRYLTAAQLQMDASRSTDSIPLFLYIFIRNMVPILRGVGSVSFPDFPIIISEVVLPPSTIGPSAKTNISLNSRDLALSINYVDYGRIYLLEEGFSN